MKKLSFRSLFVVTKRALVLARAPCATLPLSRPVGPHLYRAAPARSRERGFSVGLAAALRESAAAHAPTPSKYPAMTRPREAAEQLQGHIRICQGQIPF
jgi:hypothetical protein